MVNNKLSSSETGSGSSGSNPGNQGDTLADLANSEISLDLQGLIDDAHFGADAENLFGDLIDNSGQNTVSIDTFIDFFQIVRNQRVTK